MKSNNGNGFNLISVIVIVCVVSIISGITTGIIVTNTYSGISSDDKALNEFLRVYSDIVGNYYEDIDKEEMLNKAVDAMLNYLGDSYTTYLNSEEREALEERLSATYKGIGVSFLKREIKSVTEGSPAEEAGLMAGDIFTKIDGVDVTSMLDDSIGSLIKKSNKEKVTIEVQRGEEILSFVINIKTLQNKVISSNMIENTTIGYINVPIFAKSVSSQVEKALNDLESKGMTKLILDLRDDSGGFLDEAQSMASLFLEKDKILFSLEDKDGREVYKDQTEAKKDYQIVILVNENSASAAEILAAALKDSYSNATIVGTKSFGKGKVQQTYTKTDGAMVKLTSARWFRPNGECIDGIGITPDYAVDIETITNEDGTITKIDSQLNKALEILGHNLVSFLF